MAACRRVLHGFRHAQLLLRGSAGAARGLRKWTTGCAVADTEVASSSFWQEEQRSWSREGRASASWRLVTERGVHSTGRREEEEEDAKQNAFRSHVRYGGGAKVDRDGVTAKIANEEARELVQQVHLASLRQRLRDDPRDTISYEELLHLCRTVGVASSDEDAVHMAHALNQAGVVLTFRDKVHLHPEKIAELVANVLPLSLLGEDDQRRMELAAMLKRKQEIDKKAHKQMRVVSWAGLGLLTIQVMVFFRLTFWELSWDVMEPIAFSATASGLICGYTYFMLTSSDPSYQDFMQRIYHSRQRKLFRKQNFDIKRFKELQMQYQTGWKPLSKKVLKDAD